MTTPTPSSTRDADTMEFDVMIGATIRAASLEEAIETALAITATGVTGISVEVVCSRAIASQEKQS